jgi:cation:H+ antiporter
MLIYVLFILGFVLLIKGADFLVEGASSVAKKFNISNIVIGLTIVAFGTSMPEFIVSFIASLNGNTDIAIGNILGSNIANIFLILGISSIIYPLATKKNTIWKEIPFSLLSALVLLFLVSDNFIDGLGFSALTKIDGLILLSFFIIFLYYTFGISKVNTESDDTDIKVKSLSNTKSIFFILIGLVCLVVGGKWIVDGAVKIANILHMSESLIGLTIVAVGTSLPELATSAVAAYKKHTDIAIGNIVGSNIFNILFILGSSAMVGNLNFDKSSYIDVFMTIFASLFLFVMMFLGKKHIIERWQGFIMILVYVAYVVLLIFIK